MAVGSFLNRDYLNARVSNVVIGVRNQLDDVLRVYTFFQNENNSDELAAIYSQAELFEINRALAPLAKVARAAHNQDTIPVQDDHFFWADTVTGPN
jgi:hypothetical protein